MKNALRHYGIFALRALMTAAIFYLLSRQIDLAQVRHYVQGIEYRWLIGTYGMMHAGYICSTERMRHYYRSIGVTMPFYQAFHLFYRASLLNTILPGGIGGDGYRIYTIGHNTGASYKRLLKLSLSERLNGLWVLAIFALGFCATLAWPHVSYTMQWIIAGVGSISGTIFYFFLASSLLEEERGTTLYAGIYSLGTQLCSLAGAYCLLHAISVKAGFTFAMLPYLTLFLLSSIASCLPISLGGVGMREATFLYGSHIIPIESSMGVAFAAVYYILHSSLGLLSMVLPMTLSTRSLANRKPS